MKERFSLIAICLLISIIFANFSAYSDVQLVETMTLPVSNKIIVLDAGHGTPDEGGLIIETMQRRTHT